jgi:hypothetical protein
MAFHYSYSGVTVGTKLTIIALLSSSPARMLSSRLPSSSLAAAKENGVREKR